MTEKEISQDVLKKIEAQNITPRPRWHFVLRNIVVWVIAILCIIIGALTVSIMIFVFTHGAWDARELLQRGPFEHFFAIFPVMWLISFVLFLIFAEYAVRATKMGYKYSTMVLALIIIGISIIGGSILHLVGVSQRADNSFGEHVPYYKTVEMRQNRFLHIPENGRVVGVVSEIGGDALTLINIMTDTVYYIDTRNTIQPKHMPIRVGMRVAVFGVQQSDNVISAERIIPVKALHDERQHNRDDYRERGRHQRTKNLNQ